MILLLPYVAGLSVQCRLRGPVGRDFILGCSFVLAFLALVASPVFAVLRNHRKLFIGAPLDIVKLFWGFVRWEMLKSTVLFLLAIGIGRCFANTLKSADWIFLLACAPVPSILFLLFCLNLTFGLARQVFVIAVSGLTVIAISSDWEAMAAFYPSFAAYFLMESPTLFARIRAGVYRSVDPERSDFLMPITCELPRFIRPQICLPIAGISTIISGILFEMDPGAIRFNLYPASLAFLSIGSDYGDSNVFFFVKLTTVLTGFAALLSLGTLRVTANSIAMSRGVKIMSVFRSFRHHWICFIVMSFWLFEGRDEAWLFLSELGGWFIMAGVFGLFLTNRWPGVKLTAFAAACISLFFLVGSFYAAHAITYQMSGTPPPSWLRTEYGYLGRVVLQVTIMAVCFTVTGLLMRSGLTAIICAAGILIAGVRFSLEIMFIPGERFTVRTISSVAIDIRVGYERPDGTTLLYEAPMLVYHYQDRDPWIVARNELTPLFMPQMRARPFVSIHLHGEDAPIFRLRRLRQTDEIIVTPDHVRIGGAYSRWPKYVLVSHGAELVEDENPVLPE